MSVRPQNTAPTRPKTTQFTLLGWFEDEGVIQQSNYRRMVCNTQRMRPPPMRGC